MRCTQVTSFICLVSDGLGTAAFLGKCCSPRQVQLFLASLVLFPGEVCSQVGLGLCRELCSDKAPISGSSFAPVSPLFWLRPVLGSLSPEWADILNGCSSIAPGLLGFGISCSDEPFPEDLLKLRLLERSPRSGFTCPSPCSLPSAVSESLWALEIQGIWQELQDRTGSVCPVPFISDRPHPELASPTAECGWRIPGSHGRDIC